MRLGISPATLEAETEQFYDNPDPVAEKAVLTRLIGDFANQKLNGDSDEQQEATGESAAGTEGAGPTEEVDGPDAVTSGTDAEGSGAGTDGQAATGEESGPGIAAAPTAEVGLPPIPDADAGLGQAGTPSGERIPYPKPKPLPGIPDPDAGLGDVGERGGERIPYPEPKKEGKKVYGGSKPRPPGTDLLLSIASAYKQGGQKQGRTPISDGKKVAQRLVDSVTDRLGLHHVVVKTAKKTAEGGDAHTYKRKIARKIDQIELYREDLVALGAAGDNMNDAVRAAVAMETILHELGHLFEIQVLDQLPAPDQRALRAANKAWVVSVKDLDGVGRLQSRETPMHVVGTTAGFKKSNRPDFEDWDFFLA